jgi:hypothetical protein
VKDAQARQNVVRDESMSAAWKNNMHRRSLRETISVRNVVLLGLMLGVSVPATAAQEAADNTANGIANMAATKDLTGVYQSIPSGTALPGGLKNSGSPSSVALSRAAADQMKSINAKDDPGRVCLPVGPFRMMATERVKIELAPGPGILVILFEDVSRGHMRVVYMKRGHPQKLEPTWDGDSVGHWEGERLLIDTTGFNDRTWLNEAGAPHSDVLRLGEEVRPILGGKYLEYRVTAQDPKALAKPYSYTRYFEKLSTEIHEDVCEAE